MGDSLGPNYPKWGNPEWGSARLVLGLGRGRGREAEWVRRGLKLGQGTIWKWRGRGPGASRDQQRRVHRAVRWALRRRPPRGDVVGNERRGRGRKGVILAVARRRRWQTGEHAIEGARDRVRTTRASLRYGGTDLSVAGPSTIVVVIVGVAYFLSTAADGVAGLGGWHAVGPRSRVAAHACVRTTRASRRAVDTDFCEAVE
jgi:hypothetical protein